MARKGFNLSAAIRDAIAKNSKGSAKDIIELVKKAHPRVRINEKTAAVTWSKERGKTGGRKSKLVRKPHRSMNGAGGLVGTLDAAANLVRAAGGMDQARAILEKLSEM